jgi:hypothetical protein
MRRWCRIPATLAFVALITTFLAAEAAAAPPASGSKPALCAATAVHVKATTNRAAYAPGQTVQLQSSVTNISSTPCSAWLGLDPGFSPSFLVVGAKGKEVWDRCWFNDRPGGCFEVLYQHRLGPGQTYRTVAHWDQGSGTSTTPPQRVHPGRYLFVTHFQNIDRTALVRFTISPGKAPSSYTG